jgi:hypothetical protein
MATSIKLEWSGFKEFDELLDQINDDFNEKDASNILRNACRLAMQPVLDSARQALITHDNVETGQLLQSLQVEARKPNSRDKRSRYSTPDMVMIGRVTVASGRKFTPDNSSKKKLLTGKFHNYKKGNHIEHMHSDARAFAIEFGTARWLKGEGMPFIRPALESNAQRVTDSLTTSLRTALIQYQSKHMTTGK